MVCCVMLSLFAPQALSRDSNASDSQQQSQVSVTVTFSLDDFSFDTFDGFTRIQLQEGAFTTLVGSPMMPEKNIRVALPGDMMVTSIQVVDVQEQPLEGTYLVYPAQKLLPVGSPKSLFTPPDDAVYSSDHPYPVSMIALTGQCDLAGQVMADITISPLQYVPVEQRLTLITSLTFIITGVSGYLCGDFLSAHVSASERNQYQQMIQTMVMNPGDVVLRSSPNPQTAGVGPGAYDYVIITQNSWVSAFQPLCDWKTQKGVPATIVSTDWIYNQGGYSGSESAKIRAFVQDVYTNWGTTYVLLGGDIDTVPCFSKTFPGVDYDPVPNDVYYADFDTDWVCEVNIGRASVTNTGTGAGSISNFVNKVLAYEKNPPISGFAMNAGMFGFDLDSSTHAQQCKIDIDTAYIPPSWTVTTVYDSQAGTHTAQVIAAINAGQNLMNHADHSSSDFMGTGYVNHGTGLGDGNMDDLTNANKQGILYSMGCDPAAYDVDACIAEHFVQNNNGGGVAFIGNSRYGWYMPGSYDTYSLEFDDLFFQSLLQKNLYKLGMAFSDHKNTAYQQSSNEYYKYIYTELTLLGDPEMPVWTANPVIFTVSHPNQLPLGSSSFTATVTSDGSPVNQAYVCLWKGTEVYLTGYTDSTGTVTFTVAPTTAGTLSVTVTKQNYLPYEDTITVTGGSSNLIIGPISGGLFGVGAQLQNTGNSSVTNIVWEISLNGSLILAGTNVNGSIASLAENKIQRIRDIPVFGIGAVTITVKVQADGVAEMTKTAHGIILMFIVIIT